MAPRGGRQWEALANGEQPLARSPGAGPGLPTPALGSYCPITSSQPTGLGHELDDCRHPRYWSWPPGGRRMQQNLRVNNWGAIGQLIAVRRNLLALGGMRRGGGRGKQAKQKRVPPAHFTPSLPLCKDRDTSRKQVRCPRDAGLSNRPTAAIDGPPVHPTSNAVCGSDHQTILRETAVHAAMGHCA